MVRRERGINTQPSQGQRPSHAAGQENENYDMKSGTVLLLSRTNIKSDDVFVLFDKNGVVEDVVAGKKRPAIQFQFWPFGS